MKAILADYIFLLRPMILIPVWTFYLLGAHHARTASGRPTAAVPFIAGLVSFTALLGAIYIMNQIADRKTDLDRNKLFLISRGIISLKAAWLESALLAGASFALALALLPRAFTVILAVSLALGAIYSLEPLRLKRRPLVDVLANAVGNGILNTMAGWIVAGGWSNRWFGNGASLRDLLVLVPYPIAVASVHLTTTLGDRDADARVGLRTSGVVLGSSRGLLVAAILMTCAAGAAYAVGNHLALVASIVSLPFFLMPGKFTARIEKGADVLLPAKVATLVFAIAAGFLYLGYIPFLAAVIYLTRLYYRKRFALDYPSLGR
jgi:4-hydroxybenzoate polyprenyltransferase